MITWKKFMDIVNNLAGLYLVCWYSVEDCFTGGHGKPFGDW